MKSLAGVRSPLAGDKAIDFLIVRENNEGEYSEIGGRANRGQATEMALQTAVFTRVGVERAARYAAELAASRGGKLTSAPRATASSTPCRSGTRWSRTSWPSTRACS